MNIDRDKLAGWLEDKLKHYAKFKGSVAGVTERSNLVTEIQHSINSGEFDCEEVAVTHAYIKNIMRKLEQCEKLKSKWKPEFLEWYYTPHIGSPDYKWEALKTCNNNIINDINAIKARQAYKTESACKRYMNSKGWINEKEWK